MRHLPNSPPQRSFPTFGGDWSIEWDLSTSIPGRSSQPMDRWLISLVRHLPTSHFLGDPSSRDDEQIYWDTHPLGVNDQPSEIPTHPITWGILLSTYWGVIDQPSETPTHLPISGQSFPQGWWTNLVRHLPTFHSLGDPFPRDDEPI